MTELTRHKHTNQLLIYSIKFSTCTNTDNIQRWSKVCLFLASLINSALSLLWLSSSSEGSPSLPLLSPSLIMAANELSPHWVTSSTESSCCGVHATLFADAHGPGGTLHLILCSSISRQNHFIKASDAVSDLTLWWGQHNGDSAATSSETVVDGTHFHVWQTHTAHSSWCVEKLVWWELGI